MKRVITSELLDTDSGTAREVRDSLADLRLVNRWFGGAATTEWMVSRVVRALRTQSLTLLEVGAGSGDVPEFVRRRLAQRGVRVEVTLLDRVASHLNGNRRAVVGDALSLPFADSSFDVLSCGLFAHHLSPEEFQQFVNESLRVCRYAVLINDLIRHPVHLALVYAGYPLYRSRLTRHDAPASVRQAYTVHEMRELLEKTKAAKAEIQRHYLFRMAATAWKSRQQA